MQVRKQQSESDMEQPTGSKLGNGYIKALYCHPAYWTYMQSTSWEMPGWMEVQAGISIAGRNTISSDMQMTPPYGRKQKGTKEPLDESEGGEWKSWLTQHSKKEDHGIWSHHFMANRWKQGRQWKQWGTLFSWAPKSLKMVTAAMKFKDTCSLEEKLWQTY